MSKIWTPTRRKVLGATAGAVAGGFLRPALAAASGAPVVVELFTSQGCSSCPPADAFMGDLTRRNNVIAMTLNVDYWDYLGWRDTLGSSEYSDRQRSYAHRRGDGQVYTPQMVINGVTHAVGSRRDQVLGLIDQEAQRMRDLNVPISINQSGDQLTVNVAEAPAAQEQREATVWMVMVKDRIPVKIARGENTGRDIIYYNVARKFMPAGKWHGKPLRLEFSRQDLLANGISGCCVLLQAGRNGAIVGAADYGLMHGA